MAKEYYPEMHTAEHILNAVMTELKGIRSFSNHIEKKKSKCDFRLAEPLTEGNLASIEKKVNEIISLNLPVICYNISAEEAKERFDLGKLPGDSGESIRIVKIGEFNEYPCIGEHVENTSAIGIFRIASADYNDGVMRIRFRLDPRE